jgi:hypothetical protein
VAYFDLSEQKPTYAAYSMHSASSLGNGMSNADEYRAQSLRFRAEAETASDPYRRADLEWLAQSYRRLAEHADDNDASGASPPPPLRLVPQPQQQPQSKLEPEE